MNQMYLPNTAIAANRAWKAAANLTSAARAKIPARTAAAFAKLAVAVPTAASAAQPASQL